MTRTDYLRFAAAISTADMGNTHRIKTAQLIADVLEADNDRFHRAEFLLACGLVQTSMAERTTPKLETLPTKASKPGTRHPQRRLTT